MATLTITEQRAILKEAVEALLQGAETITVAAGPSEYGGGMARLGFEVAIVADPERLDVLLDPNGGVKAALESSSLSPTVRKSSGHRPFSNNQLGVVWTVEVVQ